MFGLPLYADAIVRGLILGALGLAFIIGLVRIVGLRSFSKMTAFDFVITLATGSLLASTAASTKWTSFLQMLVAIGSLMALQVVLAASRRISGRFSSAIENEPLLLMRDGNFIDAAMRKSRVSHEDVLAKLRGANVLDLKEVRAVILETTGDISVLHGDHLAEEIVAGVQ